MGMCSMSQLYKNKVHEDDDLSTHSLIQSLALFA